MGLIHSYNVRLVFPKGKLSKIGQGLLVADCHVEELNGDSGEVTLADGLNQPRQQDHPGLFDFRPRGC